MDSPGRLHEELALGRRKLSRIFGCSMSCTLKAGEILGTAAGSDNAIYHLRSGWAYQFRDPAARHSPIVDVYLPGDVIGIDTLLRTRPLNEVSTLTSVRVEAIPAQEGLVELMTDRSIALYVTWLLAQRQKRADRLLAAISDLEAPGRIALMILEFYRRLHRRKLVTGLVYNFPMSQVQIGRHLGFTKVHVNRVLRSLRNEHIVNMERHCVTILDLERLTLLSRNGGIEKSSSTCTHNMFADEIAPSVIEYPLLPA